MELLYEGVMSIKTIILTAEKTYQRLYLFI